MKHIRQSLKDYIRSQEFIRIDECKGKYLEYALFYGGEDFKSLDLRGIDKNLPIFKVTEGLNDNSDVCFTFFHFKNYKNKKKITYKRVYVEKESTFMLDYFNGYENRRALNVLEKKWIEKHLNEKFKWTKKRWGFEVKFNV